MKLFLSGATGLVGRSILPILKKNHPERAVVALVRRESQASALNARGVETVVGDLIQPRLGLSESAYADLRGSVTEILHSAASVEFDLPLEESREINVGGAQRMLELARSCPRLRKFGHVSTTYVNGFREGVYDEAPMAPGQEFCNAYQQSKFEAECLVEEAMRALPAAIYRVPALLADSEDGVVSQWGYIHHLFRMLPVTELPVMPGDPDIPVDLMPADWVAAALAHIFDFRFTSGSYRHLCLGPDGTMPLQEFISHACGIIESHPTYPAGKSVRVPKMVSVAEYDEFVKNCPDRVQRFSAAMVGRHVRLMGTRQVYLNTKTRADLEDSGLRFPVLRKFLEKTLVYCLDNSWGRQAAS